MKFLAYTYLLTCFIAVILFFGYFLEIWHNSMGILPTVSITVILFICYYLFNHRVVSRVVKIKNILLIESLLLIDLLTIIVCYYCLWDKYEIFAP